MNFNDPSFFTVQECIFMEQGWTVKMIMERREQTKIVEAMWKPKYTDVKFLDGTVRRILLSSG